MYCLKSTSLPLTVRQITYLHIFIMKTPQARAAMADLQLLSRRTDRHSNTEGDMMSLMYSDVTANEAEAARALTVSTAAVLAGVEETLSPQKGHR